MDANNLNLVLKAGDVVIYTEVFNLPANSVYPWTVPTSQASSFILTGAVSDVSIVEPITVEAPVVNMEVTVADVAGRSAFNIDVLVSNTGKVDTDLNLNIAEQSFALQLQVGENKLITKTMSISRYNSRYSINRRCKSDNTKENKFWRRS